MLLISRKSVFLLLGILLLAGCTSTSETAKSQPRELPLDAWTADRHPLISAHRGGPIPGWPENAIETFDNALSQVKKLENGPSIVIEFDVASSRDSVLVLMHDRTLDRTSTGSGKVTESTYDELKDLWLIDNSADTTSFRIPTFDSVLEWAVKKQGMVVLTIDVKRSVSPAEIVAAIHENSAESISIIITYNADQAREYFQLDPNLMLSVGIRKSEDYDRLTAIGITPRHMVAWVGSSEPDGELYSMLHEKGIWAILGTMGNLDRKAATKGSGVYAELYNNGADILSTDTTPLAAQGILLVKQMSTVGASTKN